MTPKIIWVIFFGAFIFDLLSARAKKSETISPKTSEKSESLNKNPSTQKTKKKYIEENDNDDDDDDDDDDEEDYKKPKKIKSIKENIDLRIQFCQSWSHKGYFNQVKQYLESRYSNINVIPDNYPLSPIRKFLSYSLTAFQIGCIAVIFAGSVLKNVLNGFIPNEVFDWIEANKAMVGMGAFFGGNILGGMITNTGAFEIYLNEKLIWSAINNEGKIPQIEGIEAMIRRMGYKLVR